MYVCMYIFVSLPLKLKELFEMESNMGGGGIKMFVELMLSTSTELGKTLFVLEVAPQKSGSSASNKTLASHSETILVAVGRFFIFMSVILKGVLLVSCFIVLFFKYIDTCIH